MYLWQHSRKRNVSNYYQIIFFKQKNLAIYYLGKKQLEYFVLVFMHMYVNICLFIQLKRGFPKDIPTQGRPHVYADPISFFRRLDSLWWTVSSVRKEIRSKMWIIKLVCKSRILELELQYYKCFLFFWDMFFSTGVNKKYVDVSKIRMLTKHCVSISNLNAFKMHLLFTSLETLSIWGGKHLKASIHLHKWNCSVIRMRDMRMLRLRRVPI